jgi:competence protein ComEA
MVAVVVALGWLGARTAASSPDPPPLEEVATTLATGASTLPTPESSAAKAADAGAGHERDDGERGILPDGRVVLNEANERGLCRLPGIGPSRAKRILALREKLSRFRSIRQLLQVKGIGPRTLQRLQPQLVLDAPGQDAGR